MKSILKLALILVLTTISGSSYSQSSQPVKTELGGVKGVFIALPLMDSISVKLIERKSLKAQQATTWSLYVNEKAKTTTLSTDLAKASENAAKCAELNAITETQLKLAQDNVELEKGETKKARRRGLLWFGGGVTVGVAIFGVLSAVN